MTTNTLKEHLLTLNIPEKEAEELLLISKIKKIDKGDIYIAEGQIPRKFALVVSGLFRYYYIDSKGSEFTKGFTPAHTVLSSYSAMLHESASYFFVQALEAAEIIEVDYKKWLALQSTNTFWDKFLIQALQKGYCTKEKRERELLLLDAETRYKNFSNEFPDLEKRVQLQVIASYLGIKPESLSRIRKNRVT